MLSQIQSLPSSCHPRPVTPPKGAKLFRKTRFAWAPDFKKAKRFASIPSGHELCVDLSIDATLDELLHKVHVFRSLVRFGSA